MATATKQERTEALERLRALISPGDTIYTQIKHVSRSGMMRIVQVYVFKDNEPRYLGFNVAEACGYPYDRNHEGIKVGGCGFDAGFDVVYHLGSYLFPEGFGCIGEHCPSNNHSNGDRDYTPDGDVAGCQLPGEPCTCHDPSAWTDPAAYALGCSACGCHRVYHWHASGGYALRHRTMG